jgi:hypothetical protein
MATDDEVHIRPAVHDDIPHLVALFVKQHEAMGCSWRVDTRRLALTLASAIATPDSWLCLTGDGCLMLAACFESPLGAGKVAQELCFCVPPGKIEVVLKRYEDWARAKGCRSVSLACEQRFATFERLYRRHGYSIAEMTTSKDL